MRRQCGARRSRQRARGLSRSTRLDHDWRLLCRDRQRQQTYERDGRQILNHKRTHTPFVNRTGGIIFGRSIYTASSGYSARRHASICVGSTKNYQTFLQNTGCATLDLIGPAAVLRRRRLDRTRLFCSSRVLVWRARALCDRVPDLQRR